MGFTRKLQYFLVHHLKMSNTEARSLISSGRIRINNEAVSENCVITELEEITIDTKIVRAKKHFRYFKFYKPRGFQSSLNPRVDNSIARFFTDQSSLAIAGRLDKESEGLLLLSDDGKWIESICNPVSEKEKEYLVRLNKRPGAEALLQFQSGFEFRYNNHSKPCTCVLQEDENLTIILNEGKNRQIRRMWHKLGYSVEYLCRIRVDHYTLGNLQAGEIAEFQTNTQN